MKTYIEYKNQIQGFKDVSETVKTVEKIAASSVHFLKKKVVNLNLYTSEIEKVLARFSLFYHPKGHPLLQRKKNGEKAVVIITGDKGLTGGLWHKIINAFLENGRQYKKVIVIGTKGEYYLQEENIRVIKSFTEFVDIPKHEEIKMITGYLFDGFNKGVFSEVDILYPEFISLAEQQPAWHSFLPFEFTLINPKEGAENAFGLPLFEPKKEIIFERLLQKYIAIFFYKIMLETKLSEFSARTIAMEHATATTEKLIQKLTLDYAKARRRVATQKQLEIFAAHKIIL